MTTSWNAADNFKCSLNSLSYRDVSQSLTTQHRHPQDNAHLHGRFHSTVPEGSHTGFNLPVRFPCTNRLSLSMNLPQTFAFPTSQGRAMQLAWSALTGCSLIWAELSFKVSYYKSALGEQEGTRCQPIVRACLLLLLSEPVSLSTPLRFYPRVTCEGGGKIRINCLLGNYRYLFKHIPKMKWLTDSNACMSPSLWFYHWGHHFSITGGGCLPSPRQLTAIFFS